LEVEPAVTSINARTLAVARYRLRATFARRLGGYLVLVLLIGMIGGVALGSIGAARRNQSAYPKFLASSNPSNVFFSSFSTGGPAGENAGFTVTAAAIARLPYVKHVASSGNLLVAPLAPNGAPELIAVNRLDGGGSVDGEYFDQDRAAIVKGRMANPADANQFVATAAAARLLKMHVGQSILFGDYSAAQTELPNFGTPSVAPTARVDATLVGIFIPNDQVVQDDVDAFQAEFLFTPAFTRMADSTSLQFGIQLEHGDRDLPALEQQLTHLVPAGSVYEFHQMSLIEARVERVVKPESIALGVFGGIAAVAALVVAGLTISRQLQAGEADLQVLRALGAGPMIAVSEGLVGTLGAVGVGSLLAAAIAIGLSPIAPIGPVRAVYPGLGIAVDWTVIAGGTLVLVGALAAITAALSYRTAPHRVARRSRLAGARTSAVATAAARAGLSAPCVVGVRFALEPGAGRTSVPVRSVLVGSTLAVVTVVATLTFGSGLRTLVSRPALYGWNWTYLLYPGNQNIPQVALTELDHDPDVAAAAGVSPAQVIIDGQEVPVLIGDPTTEPAPPILSGHAVTGTDQIVLGGATLKQLHKHVGQSVVLTFGSPQNAPIYVPPTRLLIVGTATLPAIGYPSSVADHTSMGTGALVSIGIEPPALQKAQSNPDPLQSGPSMVLVRMQRGVSAAAGLANVQRIVSATNTVLAADPEAAGDTIAALGVQRPAEIVNYRSMGSPPIILASGLALGAIVALAMSLAATVRRRRRDLALLKALGFTHRQLRACVAWQATVAAAAGAVIGIPGGIALGRQVWILFAHSIYAVPEPTVPPLAVILVGFGALLLANLAAALPGRIAANTPPSLVLRAE
jgi:hypothetical protein